MTNKGDGKILFQDNTLELRLTKDRKKGSQSVKIDMDLKQATARLARHNAGVPNEQRIRMYTLDGKEEEIKIPTDEEFAEYHEKCFNEMPAELRSNAIQHLRGSIPKEVQGEMAKEYLDAEVKCKWFIPYHRRYGMRIRNDLRMGAKIVDQDLPTGNWDDYYVACLEAAIGVREVKE